MNSTSTSFISVPEVELEESVLGAMLFDPGAFVAVEKLPAEAFSISAHKQIFLVMQELHRHNLKPDLLTVVSTLAEKGILKQVGGKAKLASLLDRTVHSLHIKQHASLLQQKYDRRMVSSCMNQLASSALKAEDIDEAISFAQLELEKIRSVTGDSRLDSDSYISDGASFTATVTTVTKILKLGLSQWQETARLDTVRLQSGLSKESFSLLVASLRCQEDEVMPSDQQQLQRLIDGKNATLDFNRVLPHLADDLQHDARVLNIDPLMLWQYLLPAVLSLVGKKANLCVGSHTIPAIAWTCIVGESGTGKSRAEGVILAPLKAWQKAEYQRFKPEWNKYKSSQNKKKEAGVVPQPPLPERKFLFGIATIQAVMKRLSEQDLNGSLWARDEIAGLFKSLGQFTARGESEGLECLLPMWDGAPAPVDRVQHDDSYLVDASRLCLAGGIQPGVFRQIFSDPDDVQGLQARFLFALPLVQPAKRVKGYCHLSDKLPAFYRWVDTQFPVGNIKLSPAADARYDLVYESIGKAADSASTPAVRAWMRKLPGQVLRIALALHIIECYHEPGRPKHELQIDTLDRAIELCRYYRSVFEIVQESASDSDRVSSVLLKIWDLAAISPTGLAVRDAYRQIKALARRAKELGRSVAAYTTDLYYQLEKMGRGVVKRSGRVVRFVAGMTNPPQEEPLCGATERMTVATANEAVAPHSLDVSPQNIVSPVTQQNQECRLEKIARGDRTTQPNSCTLRQDNNPTYFSVLDSNGECYATLRDEETFPHASCENLNNSNLGSNESADDISEPLPGVFDAFGEEELAEHYNQKDTPDLVPTMSKSYPCDKDTASFAAAPEASINPERTAINSALQISTASTKPLGDEQLLNQIDLESWLARIASADCAEDCMNCLDALNSLPSAVTEQIWSSAEPLLPRFWSVASSESLGFEENQSGDSKHNQGNNYSIGEDNQSPTKFLATPTIDELKQNPGQGTSSKVSPQQPHKLNGCDRIPAGSDANKAKERSASAVKELITGLWVRTSDGLYGHLGAMVTDGRWWVLFPKSRTTDAQSCLYAAVDIIPMPNR